MRNPGFSSAVFLRQAKGPLAGFFHGVAGSDDPRDWLDPDQTIQTWKAYHDQLIAHFDGEQDAERIRKAGQIYDHHVTALKKYFGQHKDEIHRYVRGMAVWDQAQADPVKSALPSLREHQLRNEADLRARPSGWVDRIQKFWSSYEYQMSALCHDQQQSLAPGLYRPTNSGLIRTGWVDAAIPYFTLIVGGLLIVGLLTRTASVAGAMFLLSVIASQPPWIEGAEPTYYQTVELIGLLVLATTGAGRVAGLDFFVGWTAQRIGRKNIPTDALGKKP